MRYIVLEKSRAVDIGIAIKWHKVKLAKVIINEKELMNSIALNGDYDSRLEAVSGKSYTNSEINNLINEGGWKNG